MYADSGTYDPVDDAAPCADVLCNTPGATEIGDVVSAQMAATNVQRDVMTVNQAGAGGGNVDSADKCIACGNRCSVPCVAGAAVTLTAKASSVNVLAGWTGACSGTAASCPSTINGVSNHGGPFCHPGSRWW